MSDSWLGHEELLTALRPFALRLSSFFDHDDGTPCRFLLGEPLDPKITPEGAAVLYEALLAAKEAHGQLYEVVHGGRPGSEDTDQWGKLYDIEGQVRIWVAALGGVHECADIRGPWAAEALFHVWRRARGLYFEALDREEQREKARTAEVAHV